MISRARLATFIAVPLVVIGGAMAFAHQQHGHHGQGNTQRMEQHLDQMAGMLTKIGASEAQKSQMDGILRGAFANLKATTDGHHQAFGQFHELLFAPSIDRERIESLRADQIKALDDMSRNFTTAFVDAAEVLSAEQRAALMQEIRRHHGG